MSRNDERQPSTALLSLSSHPLKRSAFSPLKATGCCLMPAWESRKPHKKQATRTRRIRTVFTLPFLIIICKDKQKTAQNETFPTHNYYIGKERQHSRNNMPLPFSWQNSSNLHTAHTRHLETGPASCPLRRGFPFKKHYESITITDKTRLKCVTPGAFFSEKEQCKLRNGSKILAVFLKKLTRFLPFSLSLQAISPPRKR